MSQGWLRGATSRVVEPSWGDGLKFLVGAEAVGTLAGAIAGVAGLLHFPGGDAPPGFNPDHPFWWFILLRPEAWVYLIGNVLCVAAVVKLCTSVYSLPDNSVQTINNGKLFNGRPLVRYQLLVALLKLGVCILGATQPAVRRRSLQVIFVFFCLLHLVPSLTCAIYLQCFIYVWALRDDAYEPLVSPGAAHRGKQTHRTGLRKEGPLELAFRRAGTPEVVISAHDNACGYTDNAIYSEGGPTTRIGEASSSRAPTAPRIYTDGDSQDLDSDVEDSDDMEYPYHDDSDEHEESSDSPDDGDDTRDYHDIEYENDTEDNADSEAQSRLAEMQTQERQWVYKDKLGVGSYIKRHTQLTYTPEYQSAFLGPNYVPTGHGVVTIAENAMRFDSRHRDWGHDRLRQKTSADSPLSLYLCFIGVLFGVDLCGILAGLLFARTLIWKGLALALDVVVSAILLFTMQRALPRFLHVLVVGLCALPTVPQAYVMWLSTSRIPNDAHGTPNTGIGRSKPGDYELSFLPMMLVGGFEVISIVFHIAMIAGIAWYLGQRWNPGRHGELEILLS